MSIYLDVSLAIRGLRDERERAGVTTVLSDVLAQERMSDDVFIRLVEEGESLLVRADSTDPIRISGFSVWSQEFEQKLTRRITALVPHAKIQLRWNEPDED
ncbi:hypothetical protein AB0F85_09535 [Nocardia fluminea]|uniref:hypothetical protein n=1 Tax=Nocardia fluminea TaxID=134984 RepID=UPI0033DA579B